MATVLVTGATGYVGGALLPVLLERGHRVRALVRTPDRARLPDGVEIVGGDVVAGRGLEEGLDGVDVAFYLVHAMGRGNGPAGEFAERDRRAAANVGAAAARNGVGRTIYLGGLEGVSGHLSAHLQSREEVARVLREQLDGHGHVVHVRAAMVIGAGSASFQMLRSLVERLPVMVTPRWIDTRSQPVAIADVVHTLAELVDHPDPPAEVQLGGADVLSYREMLDRLAGVLGRRPPVVVRTPILSPRLSSYWMGLVTPVEPGLARPLVEGLSAEMVVREAPPPGLNDDPRGFEEAVRAALVE